MCLTVWNSKHTEKLHGAMNQNACFSQRKSFIHRLHVYTFPCIYFQASISGVTKNFILVLKGLREPAYIHRHNKHSYVIFSSIREQNSVYSENNRNRNFGRKVYHFCVLLEEHPAFSIWSAVWKCLYKNNIICCWYSIFICSDAYCVPTRNRTKNYG